MIQIMGMKQFGRATQRAHRERMMVRPVAECEYTVANPSKGTPYRVSPEAALEREAREKRLVLFPVRLDDAVMDTHKAWAANIRRTRNVGDFRQWKSHDDYQKALNRVLRDLKAAADH